MIQRIQTLYLTLVFLCLGGMFLVPIVEFSDLLWDVNGFSGESGGDLVAPLLPLPLAGIVLGLMALTVFIMFSFKARKRQLFMGRLNYFLILALVVTIHVSISKIQKQLGADVTTLYGIATYLPVIALVFHHLANRAIKKDEELVKSLDRLR